jgi:hypothetical protein
MRWPHLFSGDVFRNGCERLLQLRRGFVRCRQWPSGVRGVRRRDLRGRQRRQRVRRLPKRPIPRGRGPSCLRRVRQRVRVPQRQCGRHRVPQRHLRSRSRVRLHALQHRHLPTQRRNRLLRRLPPRGLLRDYGSGRGYGGLRCGHILGGRCAFRSSICAGSSLFGSPLVGPLQMEPSNN